MQYKENIWKGNYKYSIEQKMVTFDGDLLSDEDLDNIDNYKEGYDDVDESSSDNENMKKILKIDKKRGKRAQWEDQHANDLIETIFENE